MADGIKLFGNCSAEVNIAHGGKDEGCISYKSDQRVEIKPRCLPAAMAAVAQLERDSVSGSRGYAIR